MLNKRRLLCGNIIVIGLLSFFFYYFFVPFISDIIDSLHRRDFEGIESVAATTKRPYGYRERRIINITRSDQSRLIKQVKTLAPDIPDSNNVKRILLITTWRSGSTFLGDLLQQSNPLTYYHFEPLHCLISDVRIGDDLLLEANNIIQNLFQCNFKQIPYYSNYILRPERILMINKNNFLWKLCGNKNGNAANCSDIHLHFEVCRRSHVQIIKVTRLRMKDVMALNLSSQTKVVYLQRDPRAIYNSRKILEWCHREVCLNISALCTEIRNDLLVLKQLQNQQVTIVSFEDLALNPMNETQRLFRELGLDYTKNVETFLKIHTKSTEKIYNAYSTERNSSAVVFRWKTQLKREEILELQESCKDILEEFGYKLVK